MTTDESVPERSLDFAWRERVAEVGRRNFENEEMLRLGFLEPDDLQRLENLGIRVEAYRQAVRDLGQARRELRAIDRQMEGLRDAEELIAQIRARRIERVRADRAEKRAAREADRLARQERNRARRATEPTFLGPRVSRRLTFTGGDAARIESRGLPSMTTFLEIAQQLEVTPDHLQWLAYERQSDRSDHYTRFEIPKRSGGTRLISSPKPAMRHAQAWIRGQILARLPVSSAAMAFRPATSIVDNAKQHDGAGIVVRIDLKDFFPGITFDRIRAWFENLGYNPGVATVLALLCTDAPRARVTLDGNTRYVVVGDRGLPQGACTSPDLANLVAMHLDARLTGLARTAGWTYTRYADDLVFSTSEPSTSPASLIRNVSAITADEGFAVNEAKTRVMRQPHRQTVTGLLVNDGVRLTRTTRRRIRAFLHRCRTDGVETVSREIGKDAHAVARGYLAYVHMVEPQVAARMRAENPWI